ARMRAMCSAPVGEKVLVEASNRSKLASSGDADGKALLPAPTIAFPSASGAAEGAHLPMLRLLAVKLKVELPGSYSSALSRELETPAPPARSARPSANTVAANSCLA